jgi:integrase
MAKQRVPDDLDQRIADLQKQLLDLRATRRGQPRTKGRAHHKLTDKMCREARPGSGLLSDGNCLYLDCRDPDGHKSWIIRFTRAARTRDCGAGGFPAVSLKEARERNEKVQRGLRDGIDPIEVKQAARAAARVARVKAMSFEQAAEAFMQGRERSWRSTVHAQQWRTSLATYCYPVFGTVDVALVDRAMVLKVIEPLWQTRTETGSRVRGRIEQMLDWAKARGLRSGENPAQWKGGLAFVLPKRRQQARVQHHAALAYIEVPALMAHLGGIVSPASWALQFAILTAGRSGEVRGAPWEEFDLTNRLWVIPAERMKAEREHRVPLSDAALAILEQARMIRPAGQPLRCGPNAMNRVLPPDMVATAHGFRSSFRDWAAERTAFPREIAEMALAHSVGSQVEQAYRRSDLIDLRRRLMNEWGAFCTTLPAAGEVVPIRARP